MSELPISGELIAEQNDAHQVAIDEDYEALGRKLARSGIEIDEIKRKVAGFSVAVPSWGAGRGGTRFAKFPIPGEPTNIHEKLEDCAVINQLSQATPRVSPHFPWDQVDDYGALREEAESLNLSFDAINSNTFQDQPGQAHSYSTGSLASTDAATRAQAVEHNIECIEIGKKLGASDLTVWVGDGTNFPGQQDLGRSLDRYLEKCKCLVDLGHHAPNANIEQIVARLHRFGKLGGFHFNDSKYGDDDLDSGSIDPHQLFLVFNELVEAELSPRDGFNPAYMIDQSHNVTDPIESMMSSADAILTAYTKAILVDRNVLRETQEANDTMMAFQALRSAYKADVSPILAKVRAEKGGAIDPISVYRASRYRTAKAQARTPVGLGSGIV